MPRLEGNIVHEGNTLTLHIADVLSYSRDLEFHIYDQRFENVQGLCILSLAESPLSG